MYGMDPMVFLETTNPLTRHVMHAIARKAKANEEIRDHNLAVRIVNGVVNAFKVK